MEAVLAPDVKVEPIKPKVGAVVQVDKATFLDKAFIPRCLELIERHTALVFPRLGLTDEEQLAFTDSLGERVNFTAGIISVVYKREKAADLLDRKTELTTPQNESQP